MKPHRPMATGRSPKVASLRDIRYVARKQWNTLSQIMWMTDLPRSPFVFARTDRWVPLSVHFVLITALLHATDSDADPCRRITASDRLLCRFATGSDSDSRSDGRSQGHHLWR